MLNQDFNVLGIKLTNSNPNSFPNPSSTVTIGGAVSGNHELTIGGPGKVALNDSNLLPNGAGNGNIVVNGTLNLKGTSQSINTL